MKTILKEEISNMKKLMKINEAMISVKDGGYSSITTDSDSTSSDKINKALLDDIEAAAKAVGLKPVITTASSGHPDEGTSKSRHSKQTAVDIAIIDGINSGGAKDAKSGNPSFREKGNKLKDALVKIGYVWNVESGNPKSVLWQTNTGGNHFNHLHISNENEEASTTSQTTSGTIEPDDSDIVGAPPKENIAGAISYAKGVGITESELDEQPSYRGEKNSKYTKRISKGGENIISYTGGEITNSSPSDCEDSVSVYFVKDFKGYYLTYCGIENVKVREGQKVERNSILGYTLDPVFISLYNSNGQPLLISYLDDLMGTNKKEEKTKTKTKDRKSELGKAHDRAKNKNLAGYALSMANQVLNPFVKRYDEDGNEVSKGITLNPFKKDFYTQTGLGNQTETWDKNKDYQKGSMVKYIGDTYEAKTNIKKGENNPEDNSNWELSQIQGALTQLYKYSTVNPNKLNEEIQNIKDLMK